MLAKRIKDSSNFKEHHEFIPSKPTEVTGESTCQKACFWICFSMDWEMLMLEQWLAHTGSPGMAWGVHAGRQIGWIRNTAHPAFAKRCLPEIPQSQEQHGRGGSQWQNWQCTLHSSRAHGQRGQLEFLLCTEKHFPRPKTLWKRENSFPLSCLLRKTHCQERCRWCMRQAGTLLQQVRAETFWERECSCERSSSRQPGRVQLDWCALCVLCASLWCFWGSSLEQGLAQPCCSLSQQPRELHSSALQPHCKAQAPSDLCLSWAGAGRWFIQE